MPPGENSRAQHDGKSIVVANRLCPKYFFSETECRKGQDYDEILTNRQTSRPWQEGLSTL
jgi:hypothetical protein